MSAYRHLFTSESVTDGHPDKLCDAISDAIVDACLQQDSSARVACETMVKSTGEKSAIILAGEITIAGAPPDYESIARKTAAAIGYTSTASGLDAHSCDVLIYISTQANDISRGVSQGDITQGAGDQGQMFGFATNESESYPSLQGSFMPLSALLSQALVRQLTKVRSSGLIPWARADGKSLVTVEYDASDKPFRVWSVVIAIQHEDMLAKFDSEDAEHDFIVEETKKHVIYPVIPAELLDENTEIIVNGTGRFVQGGPAADAGLTGRKIIVDTYGGMGRHGGGGFSGKDPSKVDRSAAYAARWAAKHVVAAGLAERCEIQLAYAIGVAEPISILVSTNGTASNGISEDEIARRVCAVFDFRPWAMINDLNLRKPIYSVTSSGGHFGRDPVDDTFSWERLDETRLSALRNG